MSKRKVKNILLRVNLKGNGIINFDENKQKFAFLEGNGNGVKRGMKHLYDVHDNLKYAKKNMYETTDIDSDGNEVSVTDYKIKISSNCVRNLIIKGMFNSNIYTELEALMLYIASPESLIRGYMFAPKNNPSLKLKSCLSVSDAEQICGAKSMLEFFARKGNKKTLEDAETSDTSIFKEETVGDIEYQFRGNIDLSKMQFMSLDSMFDRQAFNSDNFELFKTFLKQKMPSFDSELGYHKLKTSNFPVGEYGFSLSEEDCIFLIRDIFTKIMEINQWNAKSFVQTSKVEYKLVYDTIEDTFYKEEGWVAINSREDVENFSCDIEQFYDVADTKESEELRKAMVEFEKEQDKKKPAKKAPTKASKQKKDSSK